MTNERPEDKWEMHIQDLSREFRYPPTPDIAGEVRAALRTRRRAPRRRLMAAAVLIVVLLVGLLAVPDIRSEAFEWLGLGSWRLIRAEASPTPLTATISSTPSVLDSPGKTTLQDAEAAVPYPILLPSYPDDLGMPDYVFLLPTEIPSVTLVWMLPGEPNQVWFSLDIFSNQTPAGKYFPWEEEEARVNGRRAFWLVEPHEFFYEGTPPFRRSVEGNVLVWEGDGVLYRLESQLSQEEAIRIAESVPLGTDAP
jgi:hypothetical protein